MHNQYWSLLFVHKENLLVNTVLYEPMLINTSDKNQLWSRNISSCEQINNQWYEYAWLVIRPVNQNKHMKPSGDSKADRTAVKCPAAGQERSGCTFDTV